MTLNSIIKVNLSSKKYVFFENLKEYVEIMTKKKRTTRKRKTQKMMVKKGTIREKRRKSELFLELDIIVKVYKD